MGARGPLPKPTSMKLAAGNPGRRRLNEEEPIPPAGEIRPPSWLAPAARRHWRKLSPVAIAMGTLTTADVVPFARYVENLERYIVLKEFLFAKGASGTVYAPTNESGRVTYVHELPQAAEFRRLQEHLRRDEAQFGFGAAFRSRIRVDNRAAAAPAIAPASAPRDPLGIFQPKLTG